MFMGSSAVTKFVVCTPPSCGVGISLILVFRHAFSRVFLTPDSTKCPAPLFPSLFLLQRLMQADTTRGASCRRMQKMSLKGLEVPKEVNEKKMATQRKQEGRKQTTLNERPIQC
jgi:hypothetical protein